jgi:hypothetical protein
MDSTKKPQDASQFARTEKEILLGGKEVGTNAQGLAKSIDESPQLISPGKFQASGIPTGAGGGGLVNPDTSQIYSNLTSHNMTGQGFQPQSDIGTDGGVAAYQSGYAEGQTGKGGVHISHLDGIQPQQYGHPNQPGDAEQAASR